MVGVQGVLTVHVAGPVIQGVQKCLFCREPLYEFRRLDDKPFTIGADVFVSYGVKEITREMRCTEID